MEQKRYCAFISYRHQEPDLQIAKALHTAIETYSVPVNLRERTGKKRMGRVFRDQEELPLSADLGADIEAALDESEWLIAICSPRYPQSRWCLRELEYFIEKHGRDRVLAILIEGEPEESFPELLRFSTDEAGNRTEAEPLAADVRGPRWRPILKNEKLRLLAPMLSVTYDELRRRERRRRLRRLAVIAAAVVAAAAGLAVFLTVNHRRSEQLRSAAQEQARIAAEQKALAEEERLRAQAEAQQKEQARREALFNDLGERLERASAALQSGEKRTAANLLLEALRVSDENEGMRREELLGLLRRALYIEPFTVVSSFNNQNVRVNDILVSPDGARAIGIVNSNAVAVIDLNANDILFQVSAGNAMITGLQFSADGTRFLAICDYGRLVTVWNTRDGSQAFTYTSKADRPYHIANALFWKDAHELLIQDMERFYLVSEDGAEELFYTLGEQMPEYDRGNNLLSFLLEKPLDELYTFHNDDYVGTQVLATADRSRIAVVSLRGEAAVIVLDDGGSRVSLLGSPWDETSFMPGISSEDWALSPDGRTLACLSAWGFLGLWDAESGRMLLLKPLASGNGFRHSEIAFSADSARMAYTAEDQLYVADARTGDLVLTAAIDETSYIPSLAFTEDGKYLLMTNQSMFIINAETWAPELIETADFGRQYNNIVPLKDTFLITRYDGTANFYSMPSLASVQTADSFDRALCPSPAPYGAGVELRGEHRLSDAFLQTAGPGDTSPSLTFSRDGKRAVLAYGDGVMELFDTAGDGSVQAMIAELSSRIAAVAMTETQLVASDQAARLLFYDLEGRSVQRICNAAGVYTRFAFDAEGRLLMALRSDGGQIDVYSLEDFELLFSLAASGEVFSDLAFSADGAYAVGRTASGRWVAADLWADEGALLERARRLAVTGPAGN